MLTRRRRAPHARRPGVLLVLLAPVWVLTSCLTTPPRSAPDARLGAAFKNAGFETPAPAGSWWTMFGDRELTRLIGLAEQHNPTARAALARYDHARAAIGLVRSDALPAVTADGYARRRRDSGNSNFSAGTYNDYRAALNLSWEIDLWGRVRKQVDAAVAEKDAAAYEYQAALLSLRGEVTRAYLALRSADAELRLLAEAAELRSEARRLMAARFDAGRSSRLDLDRAIAAHEAVEAEIAELRAGRARFENALAALTGADASRFALAPSARVPDAPAVPAAVPSDLLRRRPDIAAAELRLAAAADRVGVVVASYLPRITLTGTAGVQSLRASDLFDPASKLWSIGPEISAPVFAAGRLGGTKAQAEAAYREALELYRETLLRAVQETEDSLADSHWLARAAAARSRAANSATSVADLTRTRYRAGAIDYFQVVEAERDALDARRAVTQTALDQALATTRAIQALGGGWHR